MRTFWRLAYLSAFLCLAAGCGSGGGGGTAPTAEPPAFAALARVTAGAAQVDARFGESVAVDGDLAVVGAPLEDGVGVADAGAAYLFRYSAAGTWEFEARLAASDGAAGDGFGSSVAVSGDDVLVGAPLRNNGGVSEQGAAYLFRRTAVDTWEETALLLASDGVAGDRFGSRVALAGDHALVGAPLADGLAVSDAGAAYPFHRP